MENSLCKWEIEKFGDSSLLKCKKHIAYHNDSSIEYIVSRNDLGKDNGYIFFFNLNGKLEAVNTINNDLPIDSYYSFDSIGFLKKYNFKDKHGHVIFDIDNKNGSISCFGKFFYLITEFDSNTIERKDLPKPFSIAFANPFGFSVDFDAYLNDDYLYSFTYKDLGCRNMHSTLLNTKKRGLNILTLIGKLSSTKYNFEKCDTLNYEFYLKN
jgi:hypothetical protein